MKVSASFNSADGDQYRIVLTPMELPEDLKLLIQDSVEVVEITLYRMKGNNILHRWGVPLMLHKRPKDGALFLEESGSWGQPP